MAERKLVLLETDDLMHPNTGESNYNESAYYNFFDRRARVGGFVRLGNRPNEGHGEMTVCIYLPDGSVGFMFKRPEVSSNDRLDAGGLKFEVVKPFEHHRITYRGKICVMKNALEMFDPAAAFKNNPVLPCDMKLDYYGTSPGWGGELREKTAEGWKSPAPSGNPEQQFARGHLEQLGRASGNVKVGDGTYEFRMEGLGLRDHSWGPRYWQAPKYYRWLTMNFDETLGLMCSFLMNRDGSERPTGFIAHKGHPNLNITKVEIDTQRTGDQQLHDRITVRAFTENGGEPKLITGKVISMIPLRNRRDGSVTRIAEGMTEWRFGDRVGYGLSEYLDQIEGPAPK